MNTKRNDCVVGGDVFVGDLVGRCCCKLLNVWMLLLEGKVEVAIELLQMNMQFCYGRLTVKIVRSRICGLSYS